MSFNLECVINFLILHISLSLMAKFVMMINVYAFTCMCVCHSMCICYNIMCNYVYSFLQCGSVSYLFTLAVHVDSS